MRPSVPLFLFFSFFCLFFITSSGGFESGDALTRYETAKSFVAGEKGELHVFEGYNGIVRNREGKLYSNFGTLQALLMVPVVWSTRALSLPDQKADSINRLVFNLIFVPALSACALVGLLFALIELGFSARIAVFTTAVVALATPFWAYARCAQEENLVALGFALWLLGMSRLDNGKSGSLTAAALGGSLAIGSRWAAGAPLAVLALITGWRAWRQRSLIPKVEWLGAFLVMGGTLGLLFGYNAYRFGSAFETGYGILFRELGRPFFSFHGASSRALALLLSPYRGILWYAPVLLVCPRAPSRGRAPRWARWSGPLAMGAALALNSGYAEWTAGYSWGPRFLIAPLVLFAPLFADFFAARWPLRGWVWGLLSLSVGWQLLSVALPSSSEEIYRTQHGIAPNSVATAWDFRSTPVALRAPWVLRALRNTITGKPDPLLRERAGVGTEASNRSRIGSDDRSDFQTLFWWPFRFSFRFRVFSPLTAAALFLAVFTLGALTLRRAWLLTGQLANL